MVGVLSLLKKGGLLKSSLDVGRYFQPRAFAEFHARQKIAQVGWVVPSNREAIDGNVVALIIGQTTEQRLTLEACSTFVSELLDSFLKMGWRGGTGGGEKISMPSFSLL